jgi:mannonate dehydratase
MKQTWRWFGPGDRVTVQDARQAGAQGIVSALHHLPPGTAWPLDQIVKRQTQIAEASGGSLAWDVVESLPISEAIKTQSPDWSDHVAAYKRSLEALATAGIKTICYNFMPVLDWTRTSLRAALQNGGTAMRFDLVSFAAFDIYILRRPAAADAYAPDVLVKAKALDARMDTAARAELETSILAGLPGSAESWTLESVRAAIDTYRALSPEALRQNHINFLSEVVPLAERLGLRLCCHPDDPPFPLLGLPRTMSTLADYRAMLSAFDSPGFGATFCTGSFSARPDNDCVAMAAALAPRVHFVHLRNVMRETPGIPCSFVETEHLTGDVDMVGVIEVFLAEELRRRAQGREDWNIPMRPDHGQEILTDIGAGAQPGYPAVGRLKGLAELRGVMAAIAHRQDIFAKKHNEQTRNEKQEQSFQGGTYENIL